MSTRSSAKPARPLAPAAPVASARAVAQRLPLDHYRLLAGAVLLILLGITALAPLGPQPLPAAWLQTPALTGGGSLFEQTFDYRAPGQRAQAITPPRSALLRTAPDERRFHATLVSELLRAQTTDGAPSPVRTDLLLENANRWADLEQFYSGSVSGGSGDLGVNGIGVVRALQSTLATGDKRIALAQEASDTFELAAQSRPNIWYYRYNWALAQMLLGHFGAATTILDDLIKDDPAHPPALFMRGLASLRVGEPNGAIVSWRSLAEEGDPDWGRLASEGLSDALAARGDGAAAAQGYRRGLETGEGIDWLLYEKLLRLELERGTPGNVLDLIESLRGRVASDDKVDLPRLLYDRGRILALLGQPGPAGTAFEAGRTLQPDDPAFHLALAQTALASGNARRALPEAEAALQAMGVDPNTADFAPALSGLTGDANAQERGQQVWGARLAQAAAWGQLGMSAQIDALLAGLDTLATGDAAHAGWYRYYRVAVAARAGRGDALRAGLDAALQAAGTPPAAPSKGAILLALLDTLSAPEAVSQADTLLKQAGGSLAVPAPALDAASAAFYARLAAQLEAAGRIPEAGPLYRAAAAWEQGARAAGPSSPVAPTGVTTPVDYRAAEANYLLRHGDPRLAVARYRQLLAVAPAVTGAWTNIGMAYHALGDATRTRRGFELAARLDPGNALAAHNLGVLDYQAFNILGGEAAFSTARTAGAAANHAWGYDLVPATGGLTVPQVAATGNWAVRLPVLLLLLLLLLHTLIFRSQGEPGATPRPAQSGLLGQLAARLPDLGGRLGTWPTLGIAVLVAGAAWAWAWAGNNPLLALVFLLAGLGAAALALGGQEVAQMIAARREPNRGQATPRLSPLGLLLAIVTAPFGLVYGWQIITRAGAAGASADEDVAPATLVARPTTPERGHKGARPVNASTAGSRGLLGGWGTLGPQARVALIGLLANIVLALVCLALYSTLGWPFWRLALLANLSVLAFTAVSDPPAEGAALWRRAPLLWLLVFIVAAAALTVVGLGVL